MKITKGPAVLVAMAAMVLGVATWHVLQNRFEVETWTVSADGLTLPTPADFGRGDFDGFLGALSALPSDVARADELEADRVRMGARASWVQKVFTKQPDSSWKVQWDARLEEILTGLPDAATVQLASLTQDLLEASGRGKDAKEAAGLFTAKRSALIVAAQSVQGLSAARIAGRQTSILDAVTTHPRANEVVRWIDRAADIEERGLERAQSAMEAAEKAARATEGLRQDAPSRNIQSVGLQWYSAWGISKKARGILSTPETGDAEITALVASLLEPAKERADRIDREISDNFTAINTAYESARQEESTLGGALSRFGRRTARRVGEFTASSLAQLEGTSADLAQALDNGITQAAIVGADVVSQGIDAYEDARKPPVQRYVESPEGMTAIAVGFLMLLVLLVVLGLAVRSRPPDRHSTS
jgi:hypothetical protein